MMLLLIDAGNTRIKWAVVNLPTTDTILAVELMRWTASGSVALSEITSLFQTWQTLSVSSALIANVAGGMVRQQLEQILAHMRAATAVDITVDWFRSSTNEAGLKNAYRQPEQLGCDRFAAAIGAHTLFPSQPLIVATCGTATTIDVVTADGIFAGGLILPGLSLMMAALAKQTAQLPHIAQAIFDPQRPFANNTDDAIINGCIAAQAGAIERSFSMHPDKTTGVTCILAGGAAKSIAAALSVPYNLVDNLVLAGLHCVAFERQNLRQSSGNVC